MLTHGEHFKKFGFNLAAMEVNEKLSAREWYGFTEGLHSSKIPRFGFEQ